jgi:DNA sulfur modification protein DndE
MQPPLETIRLSSRAAEQLQQLKRRTGIGNWNTLSRIAFSLSVAHPDEPTTVKIPADSSVEMTWRVFGGSREAIYVAALRARATSSGLGIGDDELAAYFRAHLHRGIAMLYPVRTLRDLVILLLKPAVDAGIRASDAHLAVEERETALP